MAGEEAARRLERHELVAGSDQIGLDDAVEWRGAARTVAGDGVVATIGGLPGVERPHGERERRIAGRGDGAEGELSRRRQATVAGRHHRDEARPDQALHRQAERVGDARPGHAVAQREVDDADAVLRPVGDHPVDAGEHAAGRARALTVEHADVDQVRPGGRTALVVPTATGRAGDEPGDVRAVAERVGRARVSRHEADRGHDRAAEGVMRRDAGVEHGDADALAVHRRIAGAAARRRAGLHLGGADGLVGDIAEGRDRQVAGDELHRRIGAKPFDLGQGGVDDHVAVDHPERAQADAGRGLAYLIDVALEQHAHRAARRFEKPAQDVLRDRGQQGAHRLEHWRDDGLDEGDLRGGDARGAVSDEHRAQHDGAETGEGSCGHVECVRAGSSHPDAGPIATAGPTRRSDPSAYVSIICGHNPGLGNGVQGVPFRYPGGAAGADSACIWRHFEVCRSRVPFWNGLLLNSTLARCHAVHRRARSGHHSSPVPVPLAHERLRRRGTIARL